MIECSQCVGDGEWEEWGMPLNSCPLDGHVSSVYNHAHSHNC
jgi:hypothetical protein